MTPAEVCERIKQMGYSVGQRLHLYGKRWEVVSDPFLRDGLIAVRVRMKDDASERVIYLPTKILHGIR